MSSRPLCRRRSPRRARWKGPALLGPGQRWGGGRRSAKLGFGLFRLWERGVEVTEEVETLSRLPMSRCSRFPPSSSKTLTSGHNFLRFQVEHHGLGALGAHVEADGEAGHCAEGGARENLRESTLFFSAFFFDVKLRRKKRARALKKKPFLSLSLLAREPAIDFILKVAPNFPFFPSFVLRLTAPLCRCAACLSCARAFASEQLAHESKE